MLGELGQRIKCTYSTGKMIITRIPPTPRIRDSFSILVHGWPVAVLIIEYSNPIILSPRTIYLGGILAGDVGVEPTLAGLEPAVLPEHLSPNNYRLYVQDP